MTMTDTEIQKIKQERQKLLAEREKIDAKIRGLDERAAKDLGDMYEDYTL